MSPEAEPHPSHNSKPTVGQRPPGGPQRQMLRRQRKCPFTAWVRPRLLRYNTGSARGTGTRATGHPPTLKTFAFQTTSLTSDSTRQAGRKRHKSHIPPETGLRDTHSCRSLGAQASRSPRAEIETALQQRGQVRGRQARRGCPRSAVTREGLPGATVRRDYRPLARLPRKPQLSAAGVAQGLNQKVIVRFLVKGACLSCGPGPQ